MTSLKVAETISAPESAVRAPLMLIDGAWIPAASGRVFDVFNPSDGSLLARAPAGDEQDIDRAVRAARRAFESGSWRGMIPGERAKLLWRIAEAIEANAAELAELETLDSGKPINTVLLGDIPATAEAFRYYAGWCTKVGGKTAALDTPGEFMATTWREPIGVVGQIIPWNYPLMLAGWKLAPALAAGCTVVLKPAEQTPLSALRLAEILCEVGLPPGVVNVVTGLGHTAGAALAAHMDVDKIAFTGSTQTGRHIIQAARGNLKKLSLELGGKSPTIILADASIDAAVAGACAAIFTNSGQVCVAGSRLFAEKSVFERVVEGVSERARSLKLGPGLDPTTTFGPMVSREHKDRVLDYIALGRQEGASVRTGGGAPEGAGYYVEPTVLEDTRPEMRVRREEIFGPVITATPFETIDDLVAMANDTVYGLAANVWTRDISIANRLARGIRAGTVWINTFGITSMTMPFGGYRQSGWGREGGLEGLEAYTETKSIITAL